MLNYNDVIANFPGIPRNLQENAIKQIISIFNSGKKYAVASVPTGVGKSHIAATLCRSMRDINQEYKDLIISGAAFRKSHDGNYIYEQQIERYNSYGGITLTTTKSLQNQYEDLFEDSEILKGKNNYICNVDPNYTTDLAPCILTSKLKEQCISNNTCSYYNRRTQALCSKFSVLNYNTFLGLPKFIRRRQLLVCDEATEIEDILISKFSVDIMYIFLENENIPYTKLTSETPAFVYRWLIDLYNKVSQLSAGLLGDVNFKSKKFNSATAKDMRKLNKLITFQESIGNILHSWDKCEYIIEKKPQGVTLTPYNVDNIAQNIFDCADKVILLSAFIPKKVLEFLGIKNSDYDLFEVSSPFEAKKSPIYCSSKYSLSYTTLEKNLPKIIDQAVVICDGYKEDKGIIHTHSMQITEYFNKRLKNNKRYLFRDHGVTNEDIIAKHTELTNEPTVVVSPSVAFGVSFDDNKGRFQIIVKAPYMPLSSKRIKLLFKRNPDYYQIKMLIHFLQMCGRCTRNSEDYSATFVLDGTICRVLHQEADKLPKYFLERFV